MSVTATLHTSLHDTGQDIIIADGIFYILKDSHVYSYIAMFGSPTLSTDQEIRRAHLPSDCQVVGGDRAVSVREAEPRESYCPVVIRHPASSVSRQCRAVLCLDGEGACHWRSAVNLFKTTMVTLHIHMELMTLAIRIQRDSYLLIKNTRQ